MKRILLYALTVSMGGLLLSCGVTRRMESRKPLQVTPDPQQLVATQTDPPIVNVNYMLQVPARYVPRKAQVVHQTFLVNGDMRMPVSKVYLNGRTYQRIVWRAANLDEQPESYADGVMAVSGREPLSVASNVTFPYQPWMQNANLEAVTSIKLCDEWYPVSRKILANGVQYTPAPEPVTIVEVVEVPVVETQPVIRKDEGSATLSFVVNGYTINAAYANNAVELERMSALLNKILKDPLYTTQKIVVTGICSPDGPYTYNEQLSRNRANAVKKYLVDHLKVSPDLITTEYIPEDWDGLRKMVEMSDIANKDAILSIIDGSLSPDAKDAALKRLPQYTTLLRQMYPKLRRVNYAIYYTEKILPQ